MILEILKKITTGQYKYFKDEFFKKWLEDNKVFETLFKSLPGIILLEQAYQSRTDPLYDWRWLHIGHELFK